ncbi:hypothetical protein HDU98_007972 [Podochytrium sp. JEL0797]|nr:hypothetical protein HDU98_007972 [Podochytrium sp. JEL0797]
MAETAATAKPLRQTKAPKKSLEELVAAAPAHKDDAAFDAAPYFEVVGAFAKAASSSNSASASVHSLFFSAITQKQKHKDLLGKTLAAKQTRHLLTESAFLAAALPRRKANLNPSTPPSGEIYLNIHEPFCIITMGVQGAGKSHTMSLILESCLLPTRNHAFRNKSDKNMIDLKEPMCALVLHYDQNPQSLCEATGLIHPSPNFPNLPCLPRNKMTVLVSPSYFKQRKAFYGSYCEVKPLLFNWNAISADHIKKLMRINENDNQLYMATLLELLRTYQRTGKKPDFATFLEQSQELNNVRGQEAPLLQRLNILQSFIMESDKNKDIREFAVDLRTLVAKGNLIVTDLTDPMLSASEVNGIFQLLVEQFRVAPLATGGGGGGVGGKLLALDECHKFMDGNKDDGLSDAILDTVRLMRHDGIRVVLSTQSPKAVLPEILELVSVAVMHRFHSQDWFRYLSAKIPLKVEDFEEIVELEPGEAVVFAGRHLLEGGGNLNGDGEDVENGEVEMKKGKAVTFKIGMRPRFTADRGSSRMNK